MVLVKKCLNVGCTEFILLEDGRCLVQSAKECNTANVPKDYKEQFSKIGEQTTETVYVGKRMFDAKEGDELKVE